MANEEQTQVFRGDDMPPEMAIAETGGPVQRKRPDAPADQRSLRDQEHGPSDTRRLSDSKDELADLRQLHDAQGAAELRKMDDAGDGPLDTRQLHDADGLSDQRSLRDGEGAVDSGHVRDSDGPSDLRSLQDADGLVDTRAIHDGEGPMLRHEMHDATHAPGGPEERDHLHFQGDHGVTGDDTAVAAIDEAEEEEAAPAPSDPDLTFTVEEDATPWALSIHLEARIASLAESTAKVNEQLGGLEDSIRRLAKRIGK